jgi:PKD repeat protein
VAGFSAGPTNGIAPLTVWFTNLSSGSSSYSWTFGDGHISTLADPTNTYTNVGVFSVTLTAVGAGGTNSLTVSNLIVVATTPPVAGFSAGPTNGIAPLAVWFTNLSSGAESYSWVFGDGNVSTVANPVNIYTNPGAYSVTLTAVGAGGTNLLTVSNLIVVAAPPPVAGFSAGPTNGIAPLTVWFTNLSSGAGSYSWAFGDGNVSTVANPVNVYTNPGAYSVTLTAVGAGGTNLLTVSNLIVAAAPPPVAGFSAGPTNGIAPLTVWFTNLSSGASSYSWVFGDGNLSTLTNPVNVYTNPGAYSVTLTAVGAGGTNSLTVSNLIVVVAPPPVAGFSAGPTNGIAPLTVWFTNLSSGAGSYSWAFGDGNVSTAANPVNIYTNPGAYSVALTAVGAGGTNLLTVSNLIVVAAPPPVAGFSAGPTNGIAPLTVWFTNLSSEASSYSWVFGDGNVSTLTNPVNVYTNPGAYSVTLTAIGDGGTNSLTVSNLIVVEAPPPVAGFSAGPTNGIAPLTVWFTNLSSGAGSYSWAFGDGNVSTLTNPVNTYTNPGAYTITLTAVGAGGTNVLAVTNYILVTNPPALSIQQLAGTVCSAVSGFQFVVTNIDGTPITAYEQSRIEIYATADLGAAFTNWIKLTNGTLLTNGLLQVNDMDSPLYPRRFYRSVETP